jgi:hypothetical protein
VPSVVEKRQFVEKSLPLSEEVKQAVAVSQVPIYFFQKLYFPLPTNRILSTCQTQSNRFQII